MFLSVPLVGEEGACSGACETLGPTQICYSKGTSSSPFSDSNCPLLSYSVLTDILGINLTLTFYYWLLTTGQLHLKFVYIVFNKPRLPHS